MELVSDGFEIETEIVLKAHMTGLRMTEVPSYESDRLNGVSNLNAFRDGWRILNTIIGGATGTWPQASDELARVPVRSDEVE